jgi:hypothetical protein
VDKTKSFGSKLQDYEEFVFWVFVYIFDELNWRDSYTAEFPKMRNMIISFEKKLDYTFEDVIEHFYELDVELRDVLTQPFLTLMFNKIPFSFTGRVLDVFLLDSEKVIFDILLRMILIKKNEILKIPSKDVYFFYWNITDPDEIYAQ